MEIIKNFDYYLGLNKTFRENHKIKYNNNYLMRDELELLIRQERIYLLDNNNSLTFVVLDNDSFKLYFSSGIDKLDIPNLDKDIYLDYVSRKDEAIELPIVQGFLQSGFNVVAENQEFILKSQVVVDQEILGYQFLKAKEEEIETVREIWLESLNEESNPIPTSREMSDNMGSIYVLKKDGEVLAAIHLSVRGGRALIEHLAVSIKHRRKGIGQILLLNSLSHLNGKSITLWVNKLNEEAINLYKKNGFKGTNKNSIQLIREKRL